MSADFLPPGLENFEGVAKNTDPVDPNCPFCGKPGKKGTTPHGVITYSCEPCHWSVFTGLRED